MLPVYPVSAVAGPQAQCSDGLSSLLLVENKIDTTNTAMITGTTTNGEEMCMVQAPCCF